MYKAFSGAGKKYLFKGEKNVSILSDHCDFDPQIETYNLLKVLIPSNNCYFITARQRSCGKVVFSLVSVC